MRKRIWAVLLIFTFVLPLFAGCNSSSGNYMSRGEWISALTLRFGMYTYEEEEAFYKDVKDTSEYFAAVQIAREWDVIEDAKKFRPDSPVSKGFAAETLARTIRIQGTAQTELSDCSEFDRNLLGLLVDHEIFTASGEKFTPDNNMTEPECSEVLEKGYSFWMNQTYDEEFIEITYQDGVIEMDELEELDIEILEGELGEEEAVLGVTMPAEQAASLSEGTAYTVPGSAVSGSGGTAAGTGTTAGADTLYLKVSSIGEADGTGNVRVVSVPAQMEEVLEEVQFQGNYEADYSTFVPADGVSVSYISASAVQESSQIQRVTAGEEDYDTAALGSIRDDYEVMPVVNASAEKKVDIDTSGVKLDVDLGGGLHYKFALYDVYCAAKFDLDIGVGSLDVKEMSAKVNFNVDNVLGTEGKVKAEKTIPLGSLKVTLPAGFIAAMEVKAILTAEGEMTITVGCTGVYGVEIINNHPRVVNQLSVQKDFYVYASLSALADINLSIRWGFVKKRILAVGMQMGPKGEMVYSSSTGCANIDGAILFDVYYLSDFKLGSFELNETIPIWDLHNSIAKFSFHIEDDKVVEVCTRNGDNSSAREDGEDTDNSGSESGSGGSKDVLVDRDMNPNESYSMFLKEGQSGTIQTGGSGYTFESENPSVASVTSAGKVTGAATGSTIVNIYKSDGTLAVSVSVTVD